LNVIGLDDLKWRHFIVQLACFNGFIDSLTYAIIAPTYYFRDVIAFNNLGLFNVLMLAMMLNGVTWFRVSHEFYDSLVIAHHESNPEEQDLEENVNHDEHDI